MSITKIYSAKHRCNSGFLTAFKESISTAYAYRDNALKNPDNFLAEFISTSYVA